MVNTATSPRLLVLGGPDSGKSTYRAQVYQRIELVPSALKLVHSVGDLSAIEKDVQALAKGLPPVHTPVGTYHSTSFTVTNPSGQQFNLEFADYDGEQVRKMSRPNAMALPWVERVQAADRWMYFLRIDPVRKAKSFMTTPVGPALPTASAAPTNTATEEHSAEVDAIETLQRLLFARGTSLRHRLAKPRLAVLLSCWDELALGNTSPTPLQVLQERAPLFSQFLATNWQTEALKVWGLSSTGRKMSDKVPDKEFSRSGPENHGYVVVADGKQSADLTLPLSWLMQPH